jgi:hypothetical protein
LGGASVARCCALARFAGVDRFPEGERHPFRAGPHVAPTSVTSRMTARRAGSVRVSPGWEGEPRGRHRACDPTSLLPSLPTPHQDHRAICRQVTSHHSPPTMTDRPQTTRRHQPWSAVVLIVSLLSLPPRRPAGRARRIVNQRKSGGVALPGQIVRRACGDTTARLKDAGWTVIRVWEHEDSAGAAERVTMVLTAGRS